MTARWEGTSTSPSFRQPAGEQADRERIPGSGRQTGEKEIRLFGALDPLQGGIPQVFQHGGVGNLRVLGLGLDKGGVHGIEGDVPIPVLILGTDDQEVEQRGPEGGHNGHQGGGQGNAHDGDQGAGGA